jgi:hypothetical protein
MVRPGAILSGNLGFRSNHFGFNLSGISGQSVIIEASTDLLDWLSLSTNALGSGAVYFSDPGSTNFTRRFYRARLE